MLSAQSLHVYRGHREVLHDVSVHLVPGQVLGVLGANGAGKSSLLSCLAGEIVPQSGQVSLDGRALSLWEAAALARRRAVLPQSPSLEFELDVAAVVGMGGYPYPELSPDALRACCQQAMDLAGVAALAGRDYLALSGGEKQRVQFARVLVQVLAARTSAEVRFLLLDEPTASLDPRHQHSLMRTLRELVQRERLAVLVVLHDVNLAARYCDRLLLMAQGHEVAQGRVDEVLRCETLERVYELPVDVLDHPYKPGRRLVLINDRE
jgi:iron complex transport system ATP-binding protein